MSSTRPLQGGFVDGSNCFSRDCVDMGGVCVPTAIDLGASAGLRFTCVIPVVLHGF
jgi:hypothetical protein